MTSIHQTREAWLGAFIAASRPMFLEVGAELPQLVRVSVGFPSKGNRSRVIGECWHSQASADGAVEIFIRPSLQSDGSRVADVLTHELVHAALGIAEGHGPKFRKVAKALGLEGKMTATVAGDGWHRWADPILAVLGPLPGAQLHDGAQLAGGKKTQTTRYLKVTCSSCEWTARVTAKQPVCCAKHRRPIVGDGWRKWDGHDVAAFRCPVETCGTVRYIPMERPA